MPLASTTKIASGEISIRSRYFSSLLRNFSSAHLRSVTSRSVQSVDKNCPAADRRGTDAPSKWTRAPSFVLQRSSYVRALHFTSNGPVLGNEQKFKKIRSSQFRFWIAAQLNATLIDAEDVPDAIQRKN